MQRWSRVAVAIVFLALQTKLALSQSASSWQDPSPHKVQFVSADNDVRLEVLDWGGSGRSILLLAGGGNTAHVFDEFAPKLARNFHVYGLTGRGFGASGFAASGSSLDRLRDDVLAVIDALKLTRPILLGHSIAGAELSAVAASHPDRVGGLIYLEAGYPYAFENGSGPTMKDFQEMSAPQSPGPDKSATQSFSKLQKWDADTYGYRIPESEFRQIWESTAEGRPFRTRDTPGSQAFAAILGGEKRFTAIPVPALVIFAVPHIQESWMSKNKSPDLQKAARAYYTAVDTLADKQAKALEASVKTVHVIKLRGTHYIFLSEEGAVLREVRGFVSSLR